MTNTINFEMGIIDPKNNSFDHHGDVSHSNGFIVKMASVQLLEALIIKDDLDSFSHKNVKLNHVGHLDDFVMFAIEACRDEKKIRNLYAFASRISSLDSLGPSAYKLLNDLDKELVDKIYTFYQDFISKIAIQKDVERYKLELEDKIPASIETGIYLSTLIQPDVYTAPVIWEPPKDSYEIVDISDDIFNIDVLKSECNPLRASAFFMKLGCKILVASSWREDDSVWTYSICARSAYDFDLTPLWDILSSLELSIFAKWGGHSGAGGSPRKNEHCFGGSTVSPGEVIKVIKENII